MATMMLMQINLTMHKSLLKFFSFNIIAAISWPPPLISQLFHPGVLRPRHFFTAWLFLCGFHFFCTLLGPKTSLWLTLRFVFTHISSFLSRYNDDY